MLKQEIDVFPAFLTHGMSQGLVFLFLCFVTCEKFGEAVKADINRNAKRCVSHAWRHDEGFTGGNPFLDIVETAAATQAKQFFPF